MPNKINCEGFSHECTNEGKKVRLNTAYIDDSLNLKVLCNDCYEEALEYYRDLWDQYYSG